MEFNFGGFSTSFANVEHFSQKKKPKRNSARPFVTALLTVPRYKETRVPKISALAKQDKIKLHPVYPEDVKTDTRLEKIHKSHLNILRWCKEKHPGRDCLVLEDDASWDPQLGLRKPIAKITEEQPDWDMAILGHRGIPNRSLENKKNYSARVTETKGGCHAYMVRGSSVDKVIDMYEKRDAKDPCVERIKASEWNLNVVTPALKGGHVNIVGQDQDGKKEVYKFDDRLVSYIDSF